MKKQEKIEARKRAKEIESGEKSGKTPATAAQFGSSRALTISKLDSDANLPHEKE